MEHSVKAGITGYQEIIVSTKDTATAYGSGNAEVFATPAMIALMEKAAHISLQEHLPEGFITVGSEVNIRHLKATAVDKKVWAQTILQEVEGRKLTFSVKAFDELGEIGNGKHVRYIVDAAKFMGAL